MLPVHFDDDEVKRIRRSDVCSLLGRFVSSIGRHVARELRNVPPIRTICRSLAIRAENVQMAVSTWFARMCTDKLQALPDGYLVTPSWIRKMNTAGLTFSGCLVGSPLILSGAPAIAGFLAGGVGIAMFSSRLIRIHFDSRLRDDLLQPVPTHNDDVEDEAKEDFATLLTNVGKQKFARHVARVIKLKTGPMVKSAENRIVARRLAAEIMAERKVRPSHQSVLIPMVVCFVFLPTMEEVKWKNLHDHDVHTSLNKLVADVRNFR